MNGEKSAGSSQNKIPIDVDTVHHLRNTQKKLHEIPWLRTASILANGLGGHTSPHAR